MLNRRILRIKAFKILYGYCATGFGNLEKALLELEKSCVATRDLYLFMLALVGPLTAEAKRRIEAARGKFNPSEQDLNPNEKFVFNALAPLLESDVDFQKLLSKKKLSWEQYDVLIRELFESIVSKEYFQAYLASPLHSLKEDCRLFTRIFEEELLDNRRLEDLLEEMSIYWIDDLAYALSYCCRTLEDLGKGRSWRLPELYQSDMILKRNPSAAVDSDRDFVRKLLSCAWSGYERYFSLVQASTPAWDRDRLFSTDMSIIALGLAEAEFFPNIPCRVTINEWVEVSKHYSFPKSSAFVNGLLDKLIRENFSNKTI